MTQYTITTIPVSQIRPNKYNPNGMSDEEYAEYVAEVRHLGRPPKPTIVRPVEDGFEIVDGEHGWRAAQEVGLPEIACEVIEADDSVESGRTHVSGHLRRYPYRRTWRSRDSALVSSPSAKSIAVSFIVAPVLCSCLIFLASLSTSGLSGNRRLLDAALSVSLSAVRSNDPSSLSISSSIARAEARYTLHGSPITKNVSPGCIGKGKFG